MKRVNETKVLSFLAAVIAVNTISLYVLTQVDYILGLFFVLTCMMLDIGVGAFFAALYEEIERANSERIESDEVHSMQSV